MSSENIVERNIVKNHINRKILIAKLQDLRIYARDANNYNELKGIKLKIKEYQSILNSFSDVDADFASSI